MKVIHNILTRVTSGFVLTLLLSVLGSHNIYASDVSKMQQLVSAYESKHGIPNNLLWSVAKVESAHNPFAVNIQGKSYKAASKDEAIKTVREKLKSGATNIDVGLMQVNWHYHSDNFSEIAELFDPDTNIEYAASLLKRLYDSHGSWQKAVQHYHSARPEYNGKYGRKVPAAWLKN